MASRRVDGVPSSAAPAGRGSPAAAIGRKGPPSIRSSSRRTTSAAYGRDKRTQNAPMLNSGKRPADSSEQLEATVA